MRSIVSQSYAYSRFVCEVFTTSNVSVENRREFFERKTFSQRIAVIPRWSVFYDTASTRSSMILYDSIELWIFNSFVEEAEDIPKIIVLQSSARCCKRYVRRQGGMGLWHENLKIIHEFDVKESVNSVGEPSNCERLGRRSLSERVWRSCIDFSSIPVCRWH